MNSALGNQSQPLRTEPIATGNSLVVTVTFLTIALLVAIAAGLRPSPVPGSVPAVPRELLILFPVAFAWLFYLWLPKRFRRPSIWLHPPFLIAWWTLFVVILPGLVSLTDPTKHLDSVLSFIRIEPKYAVWGMVLVVSGLAVLGLTYVVTLRSIRPTRFASAIARPEFNASVLMLLYAVIVVVKVLRIYQTGVAYSADTAELGPLQSLLAVFSTIESSSFLVIALFSVRWFQGDRSVGKFLFIVLSVETIFAFTSGYMKPMLWLTTILLLSATANRVRISRKAMICGLALIPLLVLIIPVAEGIRNLDRNPSLATPDNPIAAAVEGYELTWGQGWQYGWEIATNKALGRQASVAVTPGIIMARTPEEIPYEGFEQFFAIPAYLVPRIVWPSKPIISEGVWFSVEYLNFPTNTRTASAMTVFGEGYMYAGWIGALFAGAVLGILLAFIYANTVSVGLLAPLIALTPVFIDIEEQFSMMVLRLIQQGMVHLILYCAILIVSGKFGARAVQSRELPGVS